MRVGRKENRGSGETKPLMSPPQSYQRVTKALYLTKKPGIKSQPHPQNMIRPLKRLPSRDSWNKSEIRVDSRSREASRDLVSTLLNITKFYFS